MNIAIDTLARERNDLPSRSEWQSQIEGSEAHLKLLDAAVRELHGALVMQKRPVGGMYVQASPESIAAFHRAAHEVCSEAHRLDLRAEQMLVVVKQAWSQLSHVRARHLGDRDGDVLREIVSTSIEVFFEPTDRGSP